MSALPDDLERRLRAYRPPPVAAPQPRRAAVAAVLRPGPDAAVDVLLMRRTEHPQDPWSGHVSFPGGGHEHHDDDLLATAVRETREELGLDLSDRGELLCQLATLQAVAAGGALPLDITPFVFVLRAEAELSLNDEAEEAFWLPLRPAAAGRLDAEYTWRRDGVTRRMPSYDFEGRVVWGLTYRMLQQLLDVLGAR